MKRSTITVPILLLCAASSIAAAQSSARQYTEIAGSGKTLYKIAIAPAIDKGGAAAPAREATTVLTRDMTLIGLFKVLSPKGFLADLRKEGVSIEPQKWIDIGAQGVIKTRVQPLGYGFSIDFFLYDTAKGARPVLAKSYKSRAATVRRLAHRFGDAVVKYFTNERGIFSTRIAFATGEGRSRRSEIVVMDFDGYGVHRVSRTGSLNVLPAWSPDGDLIYTSFMWKNPDLYRLGKNRAYRISKRPGLNTGGVFSPDGKQIALTLSQDGNAEIYLISPTGALIRRVTRHPGIDTSPTWSPDGRQLAFVSNRAGSPQIYVMPVSGGSARRLTFKGTYNQEPDWCPRADTPLVAFTARDERGAYDIFTVNVTTGEVKRLTQGQGNNKSPSWAPNGRLLVFDSSRGGLWIMDSDGLNQHQIYRGRAATPDWSK